MSAVTSRRHRRARSGPPWRGLLVGVLVVGALGPAAAPALSPAPPTLAAIVVENPGTRAVALSVRAVDSRAVLTIGQVPPQGRAVFREVLDIGPEWMVMLRYGGVSAGELRVERRELVEGWSIPPAVSEHFAASGLRPAPDADSTSIR